MGMLTNYMLEVMADDLDRFSQGTFEDLGVISQTRIDPEAWTPIAWIQVLAVSRWEDSETRSRSIRSSGSPSRR